MLLLIGLFFSVFLSISNTKLILSLILTAIDNLIGEYSQISVSVAYAPIQMEQVRPAEIVGREEHARDYPHDTQYTQGNNYYEKSFLNIFLIFQQMIQKKGQETTEDEGDAEKKSSIHPRYLFLCDCLHQTRHTNKKYLVS